MFLVGEDKGRGSHGGSLHGTEDEQVWRHFAWLFETLGKLTNFSHVAVWRILFFGFAAEVVNGLTGLRLGHHQELEVVLQVVDLAEVRVHLLQWRKRVVLVFFELQLLELLQCAKLWRSAA